MREISSLEKSLESTEEQLARTRRLYTGRLNFIIATTLTTAELYDDFNGVNALLRPQIDTATAQLMRGGPQIQPDYTQLLIDHATPSDEVSPEQSKLQWLQQSEAIIAGSGRSVCPEWEELTDGERRIITEAAFRTLFAKEQ